MSPKTSFSIEAILKQLQVGRQGATGIMVGSKPFVGRCNGACDMLMSIDELVEALTEDP